MRIGEFTSQDGSAGFQAEQCLFNIRRRKSEKISELRCRSWTEMRHPAADRCEKCIVARGGARFDFRQLWFKAGAWKQRSKASYSLGCDPIDATINPGASGTILPEQSPKLLVALAQSLPDRVFQLPPALTPAKSVASRPRAPGVPQAEHRRDRRKDSRSKSRERTARAPAYRPQHNECDLRSCREE